MECKINLNYLNISWRTNFFSSLSTFKFYILIIELNSPICLLVVEIQGKWNRMALYIFFLVTFKVDLWYSKNIFKWTSHLCFPACLVFFLFHPFLFIPLYFLLLFGTSHLQSLLVTQSCLTLCDHMDCSPPGFSIHAIVQARILEWVAVSYPRRSSWSRDWTHISCISYVGRQILYHWATWEAQLDLSQFYFAAWVLPLTGSGWQPSNLLAPWPSWGW